MGNEDKRFSTLAIVSFILSILLILSFIMLQGLLILSYLFPFLLIAILIISRVSIKNINQHNLKGIIIARISFWFSILVSCYVFYLFSKSFLGFAI